MKYIYFNFFLNEPSFQMKIEMTLCDTNKTYLFQQEMGHHLKTLSNL